MFPDCLPESSERIVAIQGKTEKLTFISCCVDISNKWVRILQYTVKGLTLNTDFLGTPDHIVDCVQNICETLREVKTESSSA